MKAPLFKRLFKTDYKPEEQDLVDKLADSLNDGIEGLYSIVNRNVSLTDNIYCIVKTITITVDANGKPKQPSNFRNTLGSKIIGTQVIRAQNLTNPTVYPTSCPFISFSEESNIININNITGLPTGNNFELTIIAWA